MSADEFGPLALKAVRQHMIEVEGLSRNVINQRINRIRRIFKWAVSEQLIPPSIFEGLRAVDGLRRGRSNARETEPITPVADEWVELTKQFLPPIVADTYDAVVCECFFFFGGRVAFGCAGLRGVREFVCRSW